MKQQPIVLVLLAAFNGSRWIKKQIESILSQQGVTVRILISVDRSNDETETLVEELSSADHRIQHLPMGQHFGSASQNFFRLLRECVLMDAGYVCFADQDDIWSLDKLKYSIDRLHQVGAQGISTNVTAFWADGREVLLDKAQPMGRWNHLFESSGPGCTYVIPASSARAFQETLRAKEALTKFVDLHDWLTAAWVRANYGFWHIDPRSTMRYRQHESNEFGANISITAAKSRWKRLVNGWYRQQVLTIALCVGQESAPPIRRLLRLNLIDRILLALTVGALRRLTRDRVILALALLVMKREAIRFSPFDRDATSGGMV